MYLSFSDHRFVFDFGYPLEGLAPAATRGIMVSMFTQLSAEGLVDGICVALEYHEGLPIAEYFKKMSNAWMYLSHIFSQSLYDDS